MQHKSDIYSSADQKIGQLQAILYLLQTTLEEIKDEVDRSYELLKVGEMTELTKKIEGAVTNPMDDVYKVSNNIDGQVKQIVDIFVKSFFRKNKETIRSAFRSKTSLNDLHYSIVLNEDNIDNRNKLFDFFDRYDLLDIANRYPVYFQFIPVELVSKLNYSEELLFD